MKQRLINKSTFVRYKLDQIPDMNYPECIDALQLLNYLLRRTDVEKEKKELHTYIEKIDLRVETLKKTGSFSDYTSDSLDFT